MHSLTYKTMGCFLLSQTTKTMAQRLISHHNKKNHKETKSRHKWSTRVTLEHDEM